MIKKDDNVTFLSGSLVVGGFIILMWFLSYPDRTRDTYFTQALTQNKLTEVNVQDVLNVRDYDCPYQILFTAVNDKKEKVRAKYCAGRYSVEGTIQIREKF